MEPTKKQLKSIQKIARYLANRYKFGYYDTEDIEQEAIIFGLEVLEKYDETKGASLETFLYTHISRRLSNLKRDKFYRPSFNVNSEEPRQSNECKKNLMSPIDIDNVSDEKEGAMSTPSTQLHSVYEKEAIAIINRELPIDLRVDYLKMREGVYVNKTRREEIEHVVRIILERYGYD